MRSEKSQLGLPGNGRDSGGDKKGFRLGLPDEPARFGHPSADKYKDPKASKDLRRTRQGVFDARTFKMISKLQRKGLFEELGGSVKSGKESIVHFATASRVPGLVALKIFRTSALAFTKRRGYTDGDWRMRRAVTSSRNTGKMVSTWALKEFRNLKRLAASGVPCPEPIAVEGHVLAMEFLNDGCGPRPAPILKDLDDYGVDRESWLYIYADVVISMWKMFCRANLVHGDLSEYNIVYHNNRAKVIDVGQSVDLSHPRAHELLRRDIRVINNFFQRRCGSLGDKELFMYVTDRRLLDGKEEIDIVDSIIGKARKWDESDLHTNRAFKVAEIPKHIDQLPMKLGKDMGGSIGENSFLDPEMVQRMFGENNVARFFSRQKPENVTYYKVPLKAPGGKVTGRMTPEVLENMDSKEFGALIESVVSNISEKYGDLFGVVPKKEPLPKVAKRTGGRPSVLEDFLDNFNVTELLNLRKMQKDSQRIPETRPRPRKPSALKDAIGKRRMSLSDALNGLRLEEEEDHVPDSAPKKKHTKAIHDDEISALSDYLNNENPRDEDAGEDMLDISSL